MDDHGHHLESHTAFMQSFVSVSGDQKGKPTVIIRYSIKLHRVRVSALCWLPPSEGVKTRFRARTNVL